MYPQPVMRVRVLLGYGFSNPYPNPGKTRELTLGFALPVTIPRARASLFWPALTLALRGSGQPQLALARGQLGPGPVGQGRP